MFMNKQARLISVRGGRGALKAIYTSALNRGVKHYHPVTGHLLATPEEILTCVERRGEIIVEDLHNGGPDNRKSSADSATGNCEW